MNRLTAWVRAFFSLSRRETRGFLILLPLMALSVFITPAYHWWKSGQPRDFTKENQELDSLLTHWRWKEKSDTVRIEKTLFEFNPNKASKDELIALGFSVSLANRIDNYRAKNGKFIIKSDLKKIYGMDSTLYIELYAYIDLPKEKPVILRDKKTLPEKTASVINEKFNLNLADTTQLIRIYGIGSKLSQRIIKYRNSLGGFISMNQLKEVYGLDSAVVKELNKKVFIDYEFQPARLAINTVSEKELGAHPYIKYNLAKAITTYRFQHGNFSSIEDLKKIALVDESFFTKIKPYLTLNP